MAKAYQARKRRSLPPVKPAPRDLVFDYKDSRSLGRFLMENGALAPRERTGLSQKQQRNLAREVKRARHLAMLPFTQTL